MTRMDRTEEKLIEALNQASITQYASISEVLRSNLSRHLILNIWLKSFDSTISGTEVIYIFKLLGIDIPDDF